jgi:hypothetical protein
MELWLPDLDTFGGFGKDPMLIVFRSCLGGFADPWGCGTFGRLDVGAWLNFDELGRRIWLPDGVTEGSGSPFDGGAGVEGADEASDDFLVLSTGRDGRGPVGGKEGRGRAVAAIAEYSTRVCDSDSSSNYAAMYRTTTSRIGKMGRVLEAEKTGCRQGEQWS